VQAQSTWDGSEAVKNWSTFLNWSTGVSPEGTAVIFNGTGIGPAGTSTSIVDQSFNITTLTVNYSHLTSRHTLEIADGQTLTQTGDFTMGGALASQAMRFTVTGDGAWVINAPAGTFTAANTTVGSRPLELDMSGLARFEATVANFNIGTGAQQSVSTVLLAQDSTITATTMRLGGSSNTGTLTGSQVRLGETTTFNATNIVVGSGRTTMGLNFQAGLTDALFTIRGQAGGESRANLVLGANSGLYGAVTDGSSSPEGLVDLRGGAVDLMLGDLVIGLSQTVDTNNGYGYGKGTFSFDEGVVDATTVMVGRVINSDVSPVNGPGSQANALHAVLNIEGGIFNAGSLVVAMNEDGALGVNANSWGRVNVTGGEVNLAGDLLMGSHLATGFSAGYSRAEVNLLGGVITMGGNIVEGATGDNQSTLILDGATLDMQGNSIGLAGQGIDTLSFRSGILRDVAEINNGETALSKSTNGLLILEGNNTYTGGTNIIFGTLQVGTGGVTGTLGTGDIQLSDGELAINRSDLVEIGDSISGYLGFFTQMGSGRTVLSGDNSDFQAAVFSVTNGILEAANVNAMGSQITVGPLTPYLYVSAGAEFHFKPVETTPQTLQLTLLDLADGSTLGVQLGNAINVGTADVDGTIQIKLFENSDFTPVNGQSLNVLTAPGGLLDATYTLTLYNNTSFTAVLNPATNTAVSATTTAVAALDEAWWVGNRVAGHAGEWAVSNGTTSNWASSSTGTTTPVVPGAGTDVFISATGANATTQNNMTLGADMSVNSITVLSPNAVTMLEDPLYRLTVVGNDAITLDVGAGTTTFLNRLLLAGAAPVLEVNSANALVLSGILEGENGFTKTGTGTLRVDGAQTSTLTGLISVNGGVLELGKTGGGDAVATGLAIGSGAMAQLLASDQIADTASLAVAGGGEFDLNGFNEAVGGLTGAGTVTNSQAASTAVFTVGGSADPGSLFTGTLEDGGVDALLALVKTGEGTQILGGVNTFTGGTTILAGTLRQEIAGALSTGAVTLNGATAVWDMNGIDHTASVVTLDGGGLIQGSGAVLTSTATYQIRAGEAAVVLAGANGLAKTGDGTAILSGANIYTGLSDLGGTGVLRLTTDTGLGAVGAGNTTLIRGFAGNSVTLELAGGITVAEALTFEGRSGAAEGVAALRNLSGDNTLSGNIDFSFGGSYYNIESQAGLFTISGNISESLGGSRILRLFGDGDGLITGNITGHTTGGITVLKQGAGTWTLGGTNTRVNLVQIDQGVLKPTSDLTVAGQLAFGSGNTVATAGTLDLTEASATFTSLVAQTNSTTNASEVLIGAGESLNINGNVRLGSNASALTTTLFNVSGEGALNITNTASGAFVQVGGYSGATGGQGNAVLVDMRELETLNVSLSTANGILRIGNNTTANANGRVEFYAARNTTITANSLVVGAGGQFNGQNDTTQALYLGTGSTLLYVNQLELGTGLRDFGRLAFQGAEGTLVVRAADGLGRANLIVGGGVGNTGVGSANNFNHFDVRDHEVDLLLGAVSVGTQANRAAPSLSVFDFNQGVLDMQSLRAGTRGNQTNGNGEGLTTREITAEVNLGGGFTTIQDGVLALGEILAIGTADLTRTHIATGTLNITGDARVTIGETGGVAVRMGATAVANAEAHGVINLEDEAVVTVLGDIIRAGGPGVSTATVNLNGAALEMNGNNIGDATNAVVFNAQSGFLRNLGQLNGGGNLVKSSTGLLRLQGLNTYTGRTMVNEGTLLVNSTDNLRDSAGVTVAGGAAFHYGSGTANQDLVLNDLVLLDGATIGVSVGNLIDVQGNASATGTITVDFYGVSGVPTTLGTYDITVIESLTGTLNGATYEEGNYYNLTNLTVNSIGSTATTVFLNVTVTEALENAWWKGGYGSGLGNVWAVTNGSDLSNWVTNEAGLPEHNTGLVPGAGTKVFFSADGAANQGSMVLGANMGVGSLEFEDTAVAVVLDDVLYSLTLNSQDAISVAAGSQPVTLRTTVNLANAAPEIDVAGGATLDLSWILAGANGWTKTGAGLLRLTGDVDNTYTGTATVLGGEVALGKGPGYDAITGDLTVGQVGGGGTVRVRLLASDQISDDAVVTLHDNGVLTLNSYSETIGGLEGTGAVENLADGTISVLTVGAGDVSSEFEGVLRNDGDLATLELNKIGAGTLTLGGTVENTFSGVTRVLGGVLALNKTDGISAVRSDLLVGDGDGTDTVRWLNSNQVGFESNVTVNAGGVLDMNGFTDSVRTVTLAGGQIDGPGTLATTNGFDLQSGEVTATLGGAGDLRKTTGGEVLLNTQATYTGATRVEGGTLVLGVDNALSTTSALVMGAGTSAGTLDLNGFSQTVAGLNVNTTTQSNVNEIIVTEGETLTVTGNVQIGPTATDSNGLNNSTTRLNMTGGGNLVVDNVGGTIRVAVATGANIATQSTWDLSGLDSFTANLGSGGSLLIGQGDNQGSRNSTMILATNNDITAGTVTAGAGASGGTQTLLLGAGDNIFRTNTFNVGVGSRDRGVVQFNGATGTVAIGGIAPGARADFNMTTGTSNTGGTGVEAIFDVSGHQANLLLDDVTIGTQPRGNTSRSTFSFDQGTLDMNTLTMGIRPLNTVANGAGAPRATEVFMNLGGGSTVIREGILAFARVTGETPVSNDIGAVRRADAELNISGDAEVEILAATNGTAISMAGAAQPTTTSPNSSSEAHAVINILDQSVLTVRGNIVREGGPGTTSATINLDGGTLDMTGEFIGDSTNPVVLNAMAGTLRNVGELNGGGTLLKTGAGKTLILDGTNNYTGLTDVAAGTLWAQSGTALNASSGLTVRTGAAFHYASGTLGENLELAAGSALTLETGSTIGVELGNLIEVNAAAVTSGSITVDVYGISGQTYGLTQYDVITATGGGLDGATTYSLGTFYGLVDYKVTGIGWDADQVWLNIAAADVLGTAYWKGGFAAGDNVWAISNQTSSNWATDLAGTDTPVVPGGTTTVIFSATAATGQDDMRLGADMAVGGLVFNNGTGDDIALNDLDYELAITRADALTVTGTGPVVLNTNLVLENASAVADVQQADGNLTLQGVVTGQGLAKTGAGRLAMEGVQTFAGALAVEAGTMYSSASTTAQSLSVSAGAALEAQGNLTTTAGAATINGALYVGNTTLATPEASQLTLTTQGGAIVFGDTSSIHFDLTEGFGSGELNEGGADLLRLEGTLNIASGSTLELSVNQIVEYAIGDAWQLFDWTGLTPPAEDSFTIGSSFDDLLAGTEFTWDLSDLYVGGTIYIAPEPGRAVLLLVGLAGLLFRRRRGA
jgi:autotransporter-associated beta strand protein